VINLDMPGWAKTHPGKRTTGSERDLALAYHVSRVTVRKAFDGLVDASLLARTASLYIKMLRCFELNIA
jgi:hypothetical protein